MKTSKQAHLIKFVLTALCAIFLGLTQATAQNTVRMDEKGNFIEVKAEPARHDSITGKTYTNSKGKMFEVFKGKRGGMYYWKQSKKSGNWYKVYIKVEETVTGTL